MQFLLFAGRYFTSLIPWIGRFAAWLVSDTTVSIDDGYKIFNLDCRVSLDAQLLSVIDSHI